MTRPDHAGIDAADHARALDHADPLSALRAQFHIPPSPAHTDGRDSIYLCGNSLGLQPRSLAGAMKQQLDDWAALGVEGHFKGRDPWYPYHESARAPMARLLGALPHEVVAMNSLTVNLHLMLVSFFRPQGKRRRILMDWPCFPSDIYTIKSHLRFHGLDPERDLQWLRPRPGDDHLRTDDILDTIKRDGDEIALVVLAGVNFVTGQYYDIASITAAGHSRGCTVGWDLAHAAGNVEMQLHDWNPDFAVWCSYKYLNSGPGAVAGCFVHDRWVRQAPIEQYAAMPRFEGWWGNDPDTRFRMTPEFVPVRSADAWALSNPPVLALLPVKESLAIFDRVGIAALRARSLRLTAYLESLIDAVIAEHPGSGIRIITPREPAQRGCQLSLLIERPKPRQILDNLHAAGVLCDFREPNIIRVAPTPLYNSFHDCGLFADALRLALR